MNAFQQLEHDFARWLNLDPLGMVACSSGTAALHLAFEALQLPQGSRVLVPDLTMVACPRAMAMAGHEAVFVDCNNRLLMDATALGDSAVEPYEAILAVHLYGRREDMDWIHRVAATQHVIEDLAEAHGIEPHEYTDAACWSFYRNKIVYGEEGGAVWFRNNDHAALARKLRCLGFTEEHDFMHLPRGHNYRLSNAHAELILDSLEDADANILRRRQVEAMMDKRCNRAWKMPKRDAPWVYDLRVPGMTAEKQSGLIRHLKELGIAARHCFKPMSMQEEFRHCRVFGNGNAGRQAQEVFYLPIDVDTNEEEVDWWFAEIEWFVRHEIPMNAGVNV